MSAQTIFDTAPLGSVIRYSDGQPKPPESHRKKLAAWTDRNGVGRLVKKEPRHERPAMSRRQSLPSTREITAWAASSPSW